MDSSERHLPPDLPGAAEEADSRRRFLARAGLGGLAITIGSAVITMEGLFTPAYAQTSTTAAGNHEEATAAFIESVEIALTQAYQVATAAGKVTNQAWNLTLVEIGSHHKDHASEMNSAAGASATGKANAKLLDVLTGQLRAANNDQAVLQVAYDIETAAAATYLSALAVLKDNSKVKSASSILPVESQHAAVLGQLLGKDPQSVTDYLPSFVTQDPAFIPKTYPTPTA